MKIVFLPGMNGTEDLFSEITPYFDKGNLQIIALPSLGPQDYHSLLKHVEPQLPNESFTLVAESFSGPIAALIANSNNTHLKAIVFVATFITPPRVYLSNIMRHLPLQLLVSLPFTSFMLRTFLLGHHAKHEAIVKFRTILNDVPEKTLKARLMTLENFLLPLKESNIPTAYIKANKDRLVPSHKVLEFNTYFKTLKVFPIDGPHFILQANPLACAKIILQSPHF